MKGFTILAVSLLLFLGGVSCAPLQVADPVYFNSSGGLIGGTLNLKRSISLETRSTSHSRRNSVYYKVFPMDNNQYITKWLIYYSEGPGREKMKRLLELSPRYIDFMGHIFEKEGLPKDLVYVAMVESELDPYAKSRKNAIGYWQFMEPTGRQYGLKINSYVDERRDFVLSTQAAVNYFKDLYDIFEDWRLSMAAYNCGQGKLSGIIKKYNSRNFWHLVEYVEPDDLSLETRNHVPQIIAMRKIALQPYNYGFHDLNYKHPLEYDLVSLKGSSSLSYISRELQIPYKDLKELNSKFKTDVIPAETEESYIRVPANLAF